MRLSGRSDRAPQLDVTGTEFQPSDALLVPRSFHKTVHSGTITVLTWGDGSRLGESNPRPTHYENSRHRIHHAHIAHSCTSNRSPCSTKPSVGHRFVPRMVPRWILPVARIPAGATSDQDRPEFASSSPRALNLRIRRALGQCSRPSRCADRPATTRRSGGHTGVGTVAALRHGCAVR